MPSLEISVGKRINNNEKRINDNIKRGIVEDIKLQRFFVAVPIPKREPKRNATKVELP